MTRAQSKDTPSEAVCYTSLRRVWGAIPVLEGTRLRHREMWVPQNGDVENMVSQNPRPCIIGFSHSNQCAVPSYTLW